MPISTISQTISTIPEAGHRGVDVQTTFVNKQEDFQDHLQGTTVTELNTLKTQMNTMAGEMNTTASQVNTDATTASTSATTATTKASEASASASQALTSRNQAETFKNSASTSATTASTKASEASASEASASTKASEASASATTASTKASEASASEASASTKASEASASASNALASRNQAEIFAQQAQASATSIDVNNIVHRTEDETIAGVKTFSSNPLSTASQSTNANALTKYSAVVKNTGDETIAGVKTFSSNPLSTASQSTNANALTKYSAVVKNTGNETIAGVKTFTTSPVVPTPTTTGNIITMGKILEKTPVGIGYGTGAGGTVQQLTSKSTAVTLNKPTGTITCSNSAIGPGHTTFLLNNSLIELGDQVVVNLVYGTGTVNAYQISSEAGIGVASIGIWNFSPNAFSEALQIRFSILKGATA